MRAGWFKACDGVFCTCSPVVWLACDRAAEASKAVPTVDVDATDVLVVEDDVEDDVEGDALEVVAGDVAGVIDGEVFIAVFVAVVGAVALASSNASPTGLRAVVGTVVLRMPAIGEG